MEKKEIKNFMELSKLSGIPYMTLKNIFNRKSDIKASILDKLKLSLDTSLEYFNKNMPFIVGKGVKNTIYLHLSGVA
jgi:hypothetical protein